MKLRQWFHSGGKPSHPYKPKPAPEYERDEDGMFIIVGDNLG